MVVSPFPPAIAGAHCQTVAVQSGDGAGADASRMLSMLRQTLSRQVTRQNLKVERHTRPCPFLADSGQTSRQELTHAVDVLHHREGTFARRVA